MPSRNIFDPPSSLELILSRPVQHVISLLYKCFNRLHSSPRRWHEHPIRVVCISDTHTQTYTIPDGDILIHAGDMTNEGTIAEIQAHIDWLDSLPHAYKIAIAGNHDTYLDPKSRKTLSKDDQDADLDWKSVRYLQHDSITVKVQPAHEAGSPRIIKIYGAPQIPACGGTNFAFQYPRGMDAWTDTIPSKMDILVTHTPPKYHLDLFSPSLGCEFLLKEVWRTKPKLHVFGHVHSGAGRETVWWDDGQEVYEQAMAKTGRLGFVRQLISVRLWTDLVSLVAYGLLGVVWDRIWGGEQRSTTFVNASLMYQNTGVLKNPVQIVEI
jgi:predicted phosphohydrolase